MSKVTKRKITVESPGSKLSNSNSLANKESQRRQSVFERLGTKTSTPISINTALVGQQQSTIENFCRHWNQNGTCPYGKNCVFVNTHTLISPSKRAQKKDLDPKQAVDGLKRLHSTVVKRGSPEVNWDSWDQTSLEYEDEKVLEKRRQLLQRELELQMRREEGEEHHRHRHNPSAQKKTLSSSSSTSVSSTTSDSSSSSDDSSSDSSSTSGVADAKRRRGKAKKSKRASTSSLSDSERKKIRESTKSMHKDRSPSNISKKSSSSRDKRAFTPPRKSAPSSKMAGRKKSLSPSHRRHNSPPPGKNKPSTSKPSGGSRHNQSPRPPSKRSTSVERKDKHRRSQSPRRGGKPGAKERSPRPPRQDTRRRKDSPSDNRVRNSSHSRLPDSRLDDRKKDDDRSRSKDDRRQDRKAVPDRDKRDHDDTRAREKAREAAREKEREEALERCRERQREREQLAKEKERTKTKDERDREPKKRDYDKSVPPLMSLSTHAQPERKMSERDRERGNKERKDRDKDKEKERDRERERLYDRGIDKPDRSRPLEKERLSEKQSDREREKERPRERDILNERVREKGDRDRSFERERNFERGVNEPSERSFDREKDRPSKNLDRNRDRDFDRDKDRNYERVGDSRRSFEKADRTSLEKDRGMVRDRALDRVLEIRERNSSLERGRPSDGERNVERGRERFEREGRFDRRGLAAEDKGYESPYDSRRDRQRYGPDGPERSGLFKDLSPSTREDARGMRHNQGFGEDRRRGGPRGGGGWETRGGYEDPGPGKSRDWDYPEARRDWDTRNRHGEWEAGVEGDEWGRYGGPGAEWSGGEWRDEWASRPARHGPRDDQTVVSSNHIVVRDANVEESSNRRPQVVDPVEKDSLTSADFKKDSSDLAGAEGGGMKRLREREEGEAPPEPKKPRLEEPPASATAPLEEALSDISDDPDEILNREDVDVSTQEEGGLEEEVRSSASVLVGTQELDQRLLEDRPSEEENIDNLDFEEISDEELEEEARANKNKGLGDALGVDWASLVCESRNPRPSTEAEPGAARRRWTSSAVLARIGVSLQYAGQELYDEIQQSLTQPGEGKDAEPSAGLLHPVASLHVALRERQARRKCLFSGTDTFKRALSARTDIAIRRQLCNLPVASLEMQQSTGFCQWVV